MRCEERHLEAIAAHLRKNRHLRVGETTAELIKMTIGCAHPDYDGQEMKSAGQDVTSGLPRELMLTSAEIREAIEPQISAMISAIRHTVELVPPELMGAFWTTA